MSLEQRLNYYFRPDLPRRHVAVLACTISLLKSHTRHSRKNNLEKFSGDEKT